MKEKERILRQMLLESAASVDGCACKSPSAEVRRSCGERPHQRHPRGLGEWSSMGESESDCSCEVSRAFGDLTLKKFGVLCTCGASKEMTSVLQSWGWTEARVHEVPDGQGEGQSQLLGDLCTIAWLGFVCIYTGSLRHPGLRWYLGHA